MKKRLMSIILCAVMIFSLGATAFAAEDSELTRIVKTVKGRLQIPEEFTEFYSNARNSVGQKTYSLTWSIDTEEYSKRKEISVSVLSSGEIISYNSYDASRKYDKKGFAPFGKEEYIKIAREWAERVNPSYAPEFSSECTANIGNIYSNNVSVEFTREKGGIPIDGNYISVTIDKYTGEVISMYSHWTLAKDIKSSEGIISGDEAEKILGEKAELRLRYYKLNDENRAVLMYAPENSYMQIDAFTGEDFDVEFVDTELEKETLAGGGGASPEAPMMENATSEKAEVSLSDNELKGIDELEGLITKAGLTVLIRKMSNTEVASCDVKTVDYRRIKSKDEYKYIATVRLEKDGDKTGTVAFDAETGELLSLSTYIPYRYRTGKQKLKSERMESNALQFIRTWAPDIADSVKNFEENHEGEYFYFTQNVNDIEYRGNSVNMRVDKETGKILSYSKNWDKDTVFDSPDGIITTEEATAKYTEAAPPELLYIANKRVRYASNNAEELTLIYRLPDDAPQYVDAKTGETYDWSMGQTQEENPDDYVLQDDLRGHWAESIIRTLAENGIHLSYEEKFRPDEAITQKEFALLIKCFDGGARPYAVPESEYGMLIQNLVYSGIIKDSEKNGNKKLSREETVTYLVRLFGFEEAAEFTGIFKTGFADEGSIAKDKIGYVAIAKGMGLISGSSGKFNPKNNVTRAELAAMLYNSLVN